MAKALKQMLVSEYGEALADVDGVVILDPGPMSVEKTQAFRRDLREKAGGAVMRVIHNRTGRLALKERLYADHPEVLDEVLTGTSAVVYGGDGPISIAKVVREFKKKFKPITVKGAVSDGEVLVDEDLDGLADMPDLPGVRSMLLSTILGPARGIAASLEGVYGGLARVLKARNDAAGGTEDGGD